MSDVVLLFLLKKQVTLPILAYMLLLLKKDLLDHLINPKLCSTEVRLDVPAQNDNPVSKILNVEGNSTQFKYKPKTANVFSENTPIEDGQPYQWDQTKGYPYKPFKAGEYNLNMNVKPIGKELWLVVEDTYKKNIDAKWDIIKKNYFDVIFFLDREYKQTYNNVITEGLTLSEPDYDKSKRAVCEFYDHVVSFLLNRYPSVFEIVSAPVTKTVQDSLPSNPGVLHNKIMNEYHPLDPWVYVSEPGAHWSNFMKFFCYENRSIVPNLNKLEEATWRYHVLILSLARLIEEDFIILFPSANKQFNNEYCFFGGVFAFAAGFNPKDRYLKPLSLVHEPVPEYTTRLQNPMNKFFHKFKPGNPVMRVNYSFQTHNRLYVPDYNKGKETEFIKPKTPDELSGTLHYRSERQCVVKLSSNDAVDGNPSGGPAVFTIKTYLYNIVNDFFEMECYNTPDILQQLKQAIMDMQENVGQYKRKPEWGAGLVELINQKLVSQNQ
ncbi:hypothetical protein ACO0QE_003091 [Hanseniaspora vineae]